MESEYYSRRLFGQPMLPFCISGWRLVRLDPEILRNFRFIAHPDFPDFRVEFMSSTLAKFVKSYVPKTSARYPYVNIRDLMLSYTTFKERLNKMETEPHTNPRLLGGLRILVHGCLLNREIMSGLNLIHLYERGVFSAVHWQDLKQKALNDDIDYLDQGFKAVDELISRCERAAAARKGNQEKLRSRIRSLEAKRVGSTQGFFSFGDLQGAGNMPDDEGPNSSSPQQQATFTQLNHYFRREYNQLRKARQDSQASTALRAFGSRLKTHMSMWNIGISAIRGMTKDRLPQDIDQVISLLCVASAMQRITIDASSFGNRDRFLEDLDRWRALVIPREQIELFDEIVLQMWGKSPSMTSTTKSFSTDFEHLTLLLSGLIAQTVHGSSSTDGGISDLSEAMLDAKNQTAFLYEDTGPRPLGGHNSFHSPGPGRPEPYVDTQIPLVEAVQLNCNPILVLLMAGAVFAVIVYCLLVLRGHEEAGAAGHWLTLSRQIMTVAGRFKNLALYLGLSETCCDNLKVKECASSSLGGQDMEALIDLDEATSGVSTVSTYEGTSDVSLSLDPQSADSALGLESAEMNIDGLMLDLGPELPERASPWSMELFDDKSTYDIEPDMTGSEMTMESPATAFSKTVNTSLESVPATDVFKAFSPNHSRISGVSSASSPRSPRNSVLKPPCPQCGKEFSTGTNLKRHIREQHRTQQVVEVFICVKCGSTFNRKHYCKEHESKCLGIRKMRKRKQRALMGNEQ